MQSFEYFYGHADVSCEIAAKILERLRFSNKIADEVLFLIKNHGIVINDDTRSIRRGLARYGAERFLKLIRVHYYDTCGKAPAYFGEKDLFDSIENNLEVFDLLHNMRENNDSTYAHSLNVALISSVIGKWLEFDKRDMDVLTMGALFHDIGKVMIPESILNKKEKLAEQEYTIIKTHTLQGYNILKNLDLDERVALAALMHHERCDGSGYPIGLDGGQISDFAKIVAIADVYDAMTSSRLYRDGTCPFKVISIFEQEGLSLYDPSYLLTFLRNIVNSYVQNTVLLNTGQRGTVVMINNLALSRPVVQLNRGGYIDLYRQPEITIEAIL